MSQMPDSIKDKIFNTYKNAYSSQIRMDAAEFGFSLSASLLEEKEKEIGFLKMRIMHLEDNNNEHPF